ncbi:hypothetical protein LTR36_008617 [Oleoguttula mirabilis]|uniref:2-deoxy-D-gluconate 3-dehydrogenase n=1 Tax=Oleoguttula mirabilis TaxID=1507867 RepID=A0AAV9JTL6_9PEZI|nr:hypothetical protein LTR36_008617 [Oleoguttula mirabilis]
MTAQAPQIIADLFALSSCTAIVTGGTGGLGLTMTIALAEAGANITSIEVPGDPVSSVLREKVESLGRAYSKYECDVKDSAQLRAVFKKVWEDAEGGKAETPLPNILLNCAGINRRGPAESLSDEEIDEVFAVNQKALFVCCQEFAKGLLSRSLPGKLINIASTAGFIGPTTISAYAATKGAVIQMTRAFSTEWAGKGIQVNCICPGYFWTEMTKQYAEDPQYKDFNDYILSRCPTGRWGMPDDLRGAVIFLASRASQYVSGQAVVVDGGLLAK